MPSPVKRTVYTVAFAAGRRLRCELYIDGGTAAENLAIFRALVRCREGMEAACGEALVFEEMEGTSAKRIATYREEADVAESERHDEFIDCIFEASDKMRAAVAALPSSALEEMSIDDATDELA